MIVVVDDDEVMVEVTEDTLSSAGMQVRGFTDPVQALDFLAGEDPELVISDIMMPEMDGFAFREQYLRTFPERSTPFLFLSSVSAPEIIAEGLEQGAEDYLVKPVDDRILAAKVRSILKRRAAAVQNQLQGDLAQFPLGSLMKFCELKGVTGTVQVAGSGVSETLSCRNGIFDLEGGGRLERAFDLASGSFTIRMEPVDYSDLEQFAVPVRMAAAPVPLQEKPMGKLSGVQVNQRLFQVQSEFQDQPEPQILTIVILDGKVVLKKVHPVTGGQSREALQQLIEAQHCEVEQEIRDRVNERIQAKSAETSPLARFNALFEEGWELYRGRDYAGALACWEEADALKPGDKTLESNIKVVRKKLAEG
jgi:DNA-binding response OmpR family regulator